MNVAIIGCGGMGRMHAQMAANSGFAIKVCADLNQAKAAELARDFGAEATTDCQGVCGRAEVAAVAINTPTPTHLEFIKLAAQHGKHIFCEKPLARTEQECKEAIAAARDAGVKLFTGHVVRYFQEFETIKQQMDAGVVGKPGFAKTFRGGISPAGEGNWFRDFEKSGGVIFDCLIHDFDWIRYAFGDVERVFSQTMRRSEPEVMEYALVTLRMKSGVIAHVIGSWAHPSGFAVKAEVCGSKGMLHFDSNDTSIQTNLRETPGEGPGVIVPGSPVDVSPYQLEWEDFKNWLEGATPRVSPQDALEAVRIAEAALKSAETGAPVTL